MMMIKIVLSTLTCLLAFVTAIGQEFAAFEAAQTKKHLGTSVNDISQVPFEDISGMPLKFVARNVPLSGPTPLSNYQRRTLVRATAPDGAVYEGYCGRFSDGAIWPGLGESSSNANPRQLYAPHHTMYFNPADVFIGRRENGKIRTSLLFRDVGSHETAPFYFTIDTKVKVHLIVSDVNISDGNKLDVYSVIGDPRTGKWLDASVLDRRGFTSWSRPWASSWGDIVHLLWDWGDGTFDKANPNMGLFYIDWQTKGYGRKVRLVKGLITSYDAVVDPKSGQLLVVATVDYKIYVVARAPDGTWKKPSQLLPEVPKGYIYDVSIQTRGDGLFIVRTSGRDGNEWSLRTQP